MPLDIKTVRKILDDAIAQDIGITEDSDVLFAVGEPSEGGEIYLAVDTNVATRMIDDEEVSSFFFSIDTVRNVVEQQIPTIAGVNTDQKEGSKEEA